MNDSQIAIRYARALFELAREKNILDKVLTDLQLVQDTLAGSENLKHSILSPIVDTSKKIQLLTVLFGKKMTPETLKFIVLVLKNKRESYLSLIILDFFEFYNKEKGIKTVSLVTAIPAPATLISNVSDKVSKAFDCTPKIDSKVDPDILGGFILQVGDLQFDGSVSGQLNKIKQTLTKS